jgi:DNA polymerase III gamma/tau subunit
MRYLTRHGLDRFGLEEAVAWEGMSGPGDDVPEGYDVAETAVEKPARVVAGGMVAAPKPLVKPVPPKYSREAQLEWQRKRAENVAKALQAETERKMREAAAKAPSAAQPAQRQTGMTDAQKQRTLEELGAAIQVHENATAAQKQIQADAFDEKALQNWAKEAGKPADLEAWTKYNDRRKAEQEMVQWKANAFIDARVGELRRGTGARNVDDLKVAAKQAVQAKESPSVVAAIAKVADLFSLR